MADLKIVISALNNASGDLNKLKTEITGVKGSAKDATAATGGFGSSLSSMMGTAALAAGAVVAVGAAMKEIYDAAKEGAELEYAADKFDRLSTSIGATSDALLGDLRTATSGMRSDAELMASATDFMALGFAKTEEEVVRLTAVAGALNMNMNQLVLTLANQTTMRFDQLGVSVDGFDAKVAKLKETGMSASDAFQEAFLQQAEEQIATVGSRADSSAGSFDRLAAAVENMANRTKTALADALEPAVDGLADGIEELNAAAEARNAAEELGISLYKSAAPAMDNAAASLNNYASQYSNYYVATNNAADGLARQRIESDLTMKSTEELQAEISNTKTKINDYTAAAQGWVVANSDAAGSLGEVTAASETAAAAAVEVTDATNNADAAMRSYNESLLFKIASEGLSSEAALALAYAMGLVDKNTVAATKQTDAYKQLLDDGKITQAQYNRLIADLGDRIDALPEGKTIEVETDTTEIKKKLDELEMRQFKPKTLTVNLALNTGAVDNYLPAHGMNNAVGGAVSGGNPYTWQEYGYRGELFIPSQDGYVLSRAEAERALSRALVNGQSGGGTDSQVIASAVASAVTGAMNASKQPAQSVYAGPSAQDIARAVRDAILMAGVM